MCESSGRCGELLEPIAEQILQDALATGVVQTDDTPVTIQEDSEAQLAARSRVGLPRTGRPGLL
ncbi:MAG: transposase [Planctomycetes bacterium]|nr:transposase [Planctomycetota bacterium]